MALESGFKDFIEEFETERFPLLGFFSEGKFFLGACSFYDNNPGSPESYLSAGQNLLSEPAAAFYATSKHDVVGGYREDAASFPESHPLRLFWNGWDSKIGMGNVRPNSVRQKASVDVSFGLSNIKHPFGMAYWPYPEIAQKYIEQFEAMYGDTTLKFCNWDIVAYLRLRQMCQNHPHKVITEIWTPTGTVETEKVTWIDFAISTNIFPMPIVYFGLGSVDFSYAWIKNATFNASDLSDTDFRFCELANVDFGFSDIEDAVFDGGHFLPGVNLLFTQNWQKASFNNVRYFEGTVIFPKGFDPKSAGMISKELP